MKQSFLNYIKQKKLCNSKDNILLAVSGGLDSMVMLHLLLDCGYSISVAHANFQLRDEESTGDEKFVQAFCDKLSLPFFSKKFETEAYAEQHQVSIQMAARELRYQWFNELADTRHFDWIATAHHLNDSIETVLLNLVRGSGLDGLDGIEPKNGRIIRPMLFATRKQLEDYAKENKITWREDSSNANDDYQRNFIRHQVIPRLKELNPSLENSFSESMSKISGAVELMTLGIGHWKEEFETKKENQILLAKTGFGQFKSPENVLWQLIKGLGFNFDQCHQIIFAVNGQPGKKFVSQDFELTIDREFLIISKKSKELSEVLIEKSQAHAVLGNLKLSIEEKEQMDFNANSNFATLDAGKLKFPLRWRVWKPGDAFYPLGMTHKKKVSDFLIDEKISFADKKNITVLESENEIVWVVGLRIDERHKITTTSRSALNCRLLTID